MPRGRKLTALGMGVRHFMCECGYISKSKTGFRLHARVVHGDDAGDLNREAEHARCMSCNENFTSTSRMATHIKRTGHWTH